MVALSLSLLSMGDFTWNLFLRWAFVSFIAVLMISIDMMESTPVYKSGLHEERLLEVVLDPEKCKGVGSCEDVYPRNYAELDRERKRATIPQKENV